MVNGLNPAAAQQQAIVNPFQQRLDAQVRSTGKEDSSVDSKGNAAKPDSKQSVGTSFSSPDSVAKFSVSEDSGNRSNRNTNQERGSLVDITV